MYNGTAWSTTPFSVNNNFAGATTNIYQSGGHTYWRIVAGNESGTGAAHLNEATDPTVSTSSMPNTGFITPSGGATDYHSYSVGLDTVGTNVIFTGVNNLATPSLDFYSIGGTATSPSGTATSAFTTASMITTIATIVDGSGNLHVLYFVSGTGWFEAVYNGSTWNSGTQITNLTTNDLTPSLAVDSSGLIHCFYAKYNAAGDFGIGHITRSAGSSGTATWTTVSDLVTHNSINRTSVSCSHSDSGSNLLVTWVELSSSPYTLTSALFSTSATYTAGTLSAPSPVNYNSVGLTWTAPTNSSGVVTYTVQRTLSTDPTFASATNVVTGLSVATLTYTDSTVSASTNYLYRIAQIDTIAGTVYTNTVTANTPAAPSAATAYSVSGPSSGATSTPSTNFTVTVNGYLQASDNLVVTPSDGGGGGTFTPTTLTFTPSGTSTPAAQTFTYTPNATAGVKTLSFTHTYAGSPSITDQSNLSYTATSGPVTLGVNDANFFAAPYVWYSDGVGSLAANNVKGSSTYVQSQMNGAYFVQGFTLGGTYSPVMTFDVTPELVLPLSTANYPRYAYSIDDAPWVSGTLPNGGGAATTLTLSSLAAGAHTLEFYITSTDSGTDRWNTPVNSVRYKGLTCDSLATSSAAVRPARSNKLIVFGDSITGAENTSGAGVGVGNGDATKSYVFALGLALNAEYGNIGFASQGWDVGGSGNVPKFHSVGSGVKSWDHYWSGQSRLVSSLFFPVPTHIVINMGTNDTGQGIAQATVSADVAQMLTQLRAACGSSTQILLLIPFGNWNGNSIGTYDSAVTKLVTAVTNGFNTYQSATPDTKCYLGGLGTLGARGMVGGSSSQACSDSAGIHPSAQYHGYLGAMVADLFQSKIDGGTTSATRRPLDNGSIS
jgi:hypothetical protein